MRFGLAARLLAIGVSLLLVLWLTLIAVLYLTGDPARVIANPLPGQLAAIADLMRSLPREERASALPALQSNILEVRLLDRQQVPGSAEDLHRAESFATYRDRLGDSLLKVRPAADLDLIRRTRLFFDGVSPLEFWIALDGQQVLVAGARLPVAMTAYGLPVGMGAGLLGALFACIAFFLFNREIRPLKRLAAAVDSITPSGDPVPLPAIRAATPEIRTLTRAFERLQTRLYVMTQSRLALIGGIQHDVRSFATRLRLRLEKLPDPAQRERATAEIADMISLLDDALMTSQAGVGALDEELLDLIALLRAEVADFRNAGQPVTLASPPAQPVVWVLGDRLALRRSLANVLDNAVKHGLEARVSLRTDEHRVEILVDDRGPGFPEAATELLLEPFVRAEPSRARGTGGAGLGLAVAKTILEAHDGSIALTKGPTGGRVILTLPVFRLD